VNEPTLEETYTLRLYRSLETKRVLREEWYNANGEPGHPDEDLPAVVTYHPVTGKHHYLNWYKNGQRHRKGGPAQIELDPVTGAVVEQQWLRFGQLYRENGKPALVRWDEKGRLTGESFFEGGRLHRETGPAVIGYDPDTGRINYQRYWLYGKRISKASFQALSLAP